MIRPVAKGHLMNRRKLDWPQSRPRPDLERRKRTTEDCWLWLCFVESAGRLRQSETAMPAGEVVFSCDHWLPCRAVPKPKITVVRSIVQATCTTWGCYGINGTTTNATSTRSATANAAHSGENCVWHKSRRDRAFQASGLFHDCIWVSRHCVSISNVDKRSQDRIPDHAWRDLAPATLRGV